jgi:hypothetical protein
MKKFVLFLSAAVIVLPAISQEIGTPAWLAAHPVTNLTRQAGPAVAPLNGNDTLSNLYSNTDCGLNYTTASVRLGQRFLPIGSTQPAPLNLIIPGCAIIDKAYLYTEALGVAPSINATLADPAGNSTTYPMTLIGSSIDVCWGMNGTHIWRADVTASITGPGTYLVSGLPVDPVVSMSAVDVEGATLLVIYKDPYSGYTGTLIIDDGCITVAGGTLSQTMTGFSACSNSTSATAFMFVGDMQMTGYSLSMNSQTVAQPQWNWWNEISTSTNVTSGQTTCDYSLSSGSDCYTLAVTGLYYQTSCQTCTPLTTNMTVATSSTANSCNGNGTATATVTGGSGNYTYVWSPSGQTTPTATGLTAGTYTVYVNDGVSCASGTVTINYSGMNISTTSTNVNCNGNGSITATVTGGVGPYLYNWAPAGGTSATASNLAAGVYTLTVTDSTTGCVMTIADTVLNNSTLIIGVYMTPDDCDSSGTGTATAYISGGTGPFTYLWQPGNQTTSGITGLSPGLYSCTVTDNNGCTATDSVFVYSSQPYIAATSPYALCGDTVMLSCYTNVPNPTFSWVPAGSLDNPASQYPNSYTTTNISYTVTVTSACGTQTDTVDVVLDSTNWYTPDLCFVTVDTAANKNLVIWERTSAPQNGDYNIYRETSTAGVYALIGTQPVAQFTTFLDLTSNPSAAADRYMITTVDPCGNESDTSYHHRTIYLSTTANGNGWDLNWNAYEGLAITTYNIYRGPALNQMTLLTSVAGNVFTYTDANPPAGTNVYLVEALHPTGGCQPSRIIGGGPVNPVDNGSALSNVATAVPNGLAENFQSISLLITPNPGSGIFQLAISMPNEQAVEIVIMDNLGQVVFTRNEFVAANGYQTTLDLSTLSAGIYFVRVGPVVTRLIVE